MADNTVTVRLFAAARAAAGTAEVSVAAGAVRDVLDAVTNAHPGLLRVLGVCSVLLDGTVVHAPEATMAAPGSTLDVLPPFAGG